MMPGAMPGYGATPGMVPGYAPLPGMMPGMMPGAMPGYGHMPGMMPGMMPGAMPGYGPMPGMMPGAMPGYDPMPGMMPGAMPGYGPMPGMMPGAVPGYGATPGMAPGYGGIEGMQSQMLMASNIIVEKRLKLEEERARNLRKMLLEIQRKKKKDAAELARRAALEVMEQLTTKVKLQHQQQEEHRQRTMEERQMKNMEMLVAAIAGTRMNALPPVGNYPQQPQQQQPDAYNHHPYPKEPAPPHPLPPINNRVKHSLASPSAEAHGKRREKVPSLKAIEREGQEDDKESNEQKDGKVSSTEKSHEKKAGAAKKKEQALEDMTMDELIETKPVAEVFGLDWKKSFLDYSADEVTEEEKKRLRDELEAKRREKEEKARIMALQGQFKPYYRHKRDNPDQEPEPGAIMRGKNLFRTIAAVAIAQFKLQNIEMTADFNDRISKEAGEMTITRDYVTFIELAKTFLARTVKIPIQSILEDKDMQMDITADRKGGLFSRLKRRKDNDQALKMRMLKLKVRVVGIIKDLRAKETTEKGFNVQILNYLKTSFFDPRVNYPPGMLFESERTFFDISKSGTVRLPVLKKGQDANDPGDILLFRKYATRLVIGMMIHRVLIPTIILNPQSCGLGRPVNKTASKNALLVASVFYALLERMYKGGEVRAVSEVDNIQVIGIPMGRKLEKGGKKKDKKKDERDEAAADSEKKDDGDNKKEKKQEPEKKKENKKGGQKDDEDAIDEGTNIPWVMLRREGEEQTEELVTVRVCQSPEETFVVENITKYERHWLGLFTEGLRIFNDTKSDSRFYPFTRFTRILGVEEERIQDPSYCDAKYGLPYKYITIIFHQSELDEDDDPKTPTVHIICKNRFECASLYSQMFKTYRAWHPTKAHHYANETDLAEMVYPWTRWSENKEVYRFIGDAWVDDQVSELSLWANAIVTQAIDLMTGAEKKVGVAENDVITAPVINTPRV